MKKKSPEKILVVLPTGVKGGAESVAFTLVRYLSDSGQRVIVYVMCKGMQPALKELSLLNGVSVITGGYGSEKTSLPAAVWSMYQLSRQFDFDLVYSTHIHVNAMLGLFRRIGLLRCRRLVARESTLIFERYSGLRRMVFRVFYWIGYGSQDLLVAQTPEMRELLIKALGRSPVHEFTVLRNPIDADRVHALSRTDQVMSNDGRKRVVACGRAIKLKGFLALIEAFFQTRKNHPIYSLEIVGDGPEIPAMRALIATRGLSNHVFLHGHLANPYSVLHNADIGVISSEVEGFPNVLLEMMACAVRQLVSTQCTAAITDIPRVIICSGLDAAAITNGLEQAMNCASDHSAFYRSYLNENHSLPRFSAVITDSPNEH